MATSTLTRRLEARLDTETDDMITRAAQLLGRTRSAFVVETVRDAAARVLGRRDVTWLDAEVFDAMIASLDTADPAPALAAAARPRASKPR
ncbi:MAG: DUF1778 domain-containing protein [Propionibacteriaceae bacterium]|jgi:uncharacterized protein (DUF1778 family)|nr:DUF1778 domain-containing protein [Propionibacteriaceae bacterium]